ncbi:hypothetical protein FRC12_009851 [Ceratobasidium sp. 428]|nr:hypothetical protein FRC12_009851 [Ceratobasidium sp. 428]
MTAKRAALSVVGAVPRKSAARQAIGATEAVAAPTATMVVMARCDHDSLCVIMGELTCPPTDRGAARKAGTAARAGVAARNGITATTARSIRRSAAARIRRSARELGNLVLKY